MEVNLSERSVSPISRFSSTAVSSLWNSMRHFRQSDSVSGVGLAMRFSRIRLLPMHRVSSIDSSCGLFELMELILNTTGAFLCTCLSLMMRTMLGIKKS